jgi:hypothetical protein
VEAFCQVVALATEGFRREALESLADPFSTGNPERLEVSQQYQRSPRVTKNRSWVIDNYVNQNYIPVSPGRQKGTMRIVT